MHRFIIILLILNIYNTFSQNVIEVKKPIFSNDIELLFDNFRANRDSGFYKRIEILEKGLIEAKTDYEIYRIALDLGFLYTETEQHDKCIDMWSSANDKGICFPFEIKANPFPSYLSEYANNKRFDEFIRKNAALISKISENSKAEYFVNLPVDYDTTKRYPIIIILHGRVGDYHKTYTNWKSNLISEDYISVYPRGREVKGSFARSYGVNRIDDIKEIYNQVINKYSVDTSRLILAGQSTGGALAIKLAYNSLSPRGLLLSFPVKPGDFDIQKAKYFKEKALHIVMICGEQDKSFFTGQVQLSKLLDSANVEHRFIKYPNLGHGFPDDFKVQIDKALDYIVNE